MTAAERTLVDWRTWLYLKEHCTPELLKTMEGRTQIESTPDQLRAATAEMDRFVILGLRWPLAGYDVPNEFVADMVAESGGRAVGMACVQPDAADAGREFEACVTRRGLRGLSLAPFAQDFHPLSDGAWKLYDIANQLRVPLILNQFINTGYKRTKIEFADPLVVDQVALRYPDLKIVVGHMANPWYREAALMARKHRNVYSDIALHYSKKRYLYDVLQFCIECDVVDKLLFGSDSPFQAPKAARSSFLALNAWAREQGLPPLPDSLFDDILFHRPLSLLGI